MVGEVWIARPPSVWSIRGGFAGFVTDVFISLDRPLEVGIVDRHYAPLVAVALLGDVLYFLNFTTSGN